jgi:hypothetical protein
MWTARSGVAGIPEKSWRILVVMGALWQWIAIRKLWNTHGLWVTHE